MVNMLKKCNLAKLVATDIFLEANSASTGENYSNSLYSVILPYPFVRHFSYTSYLFRKVSVKPLTDHSVPKFWLTYNKC